MRSLEQVVIEALRKFGLDGERIDGLAGVWVQGAKVGQSAREVVPVKRLLSCLTHV